MSKFLVKTYTIKTKKRKKGSRLTLSLLADLHNHEYGTENDLLLDAVKAQNPDMILLAGDMLVSDRRMSYRPAQKLICDLQTQVAPVYYSCGNHESRIRNWRKTYGDMYDTFMDPLKAAGVQVLVNDSITVQTPEGPICLHGFEMDLKYYGKLRQLPFCETELQDVLGSPDAEAYHILMAHNPVYFDQYAKWGADLTVSGHLHGGIIRLPLIGGIITPQARLFPRYDRGLFQQDEKAMVVSPGLGTHTVNIRICNPAWLITIYLEGDA